MTTSPHSPADLLIRPMQDADLPAVVALRNLGFHDLDRRTLPRHLDVPALPDDANSALWVDRTRFVLGTDPGGCWVAETPTGVVGFATSTVRELTWLLHTYVVHPEVQGHGIGRALLDAAASHGSGCLRAMLSASADPAAVRRYLLAGFELHPQMTLTGVVRRDAIPVITKVREGTPGDRELMDSLDRRRRDAAHGVDHEWLLAHHPLLVSDTTTGAGYAYLHPAGGVSLLAADNRRTAERLLWAALAAGAPGVSISQDHLTGANQWALRIATEAGLAVHTSGYLAVRGMRPPVPYVHHGTFG
ncbi:GNAT family N-acetyltransferase [Nocardioides dubius]|uniref:N-acetyltransferase domain-containing protein n=1 Tax=Nocardioides dubius TaxID=317019 RepID=A0ABP4E9R7_9ACTN